MNLATVTIYDAFNYGSFLQAYALQEALRKMGHNVTVLDCSKKSIIKTLRRYISRKNPIFAIKRYVAYKKNWKLLNIQKLKNQSYDVAIVGSDEVWNIQGHFEHWPQYLGKNLNADKIIAYAPSIGFSKPEYLKADAEFKEAIKRFDAICPRDEITSNVANELGGSVTERVLDPTLLLLDEWNDIASSSPIQGDYIVYYSYLDNTPMKPYILRYAQERNLKVIIAGFCYSWGDEIQIKPPLEFVSLLKNAKCVFTSTFHGTVFSTILQKNLLVRPSGQKVVDYLSLVGLNDRIFNDGISYEAFVEMVEKPIDYDRVYKTQKEAQIKSLQILENALNNKTL